MRIVFPQFHALQLEIINDPHPIKLLACGTKFGKTFAMVLDDTLEGMDLRKKKRIFNWVAPTYDKCDIALDQTFQRQIWPDDQRVAGLKRIYNKPPRTVTFTKSGTKIRFLSGQDPDSVKGQAVHHVDMDEMAMMKDLIFYNAMTTLTHTKGTFRGFSTPKGKTWFYHEWLKGWDGDDHYPGYDLRHKHPKYKSWRAPSTANPYNEEGWIEEMQQTLPKHIYDQEYLAIWLEEGGDVFRNTNVLCVLDYQTEPTKDHIYVVVWDSAKTQSENTYAVYDASVFPFEERFVGVFEKFTPWKYQWRHIADLCKEWNNAKLWYDNTGGAQKDVHYEQLTDMGVECNRFDFSEKYTLKIDMVHLMISFCEKQQMKFLKETRFKDQMDSYTYKQTDAGNIKYGPPTGIRDDVVDCRIMGLYACLTINPQRMNNFIIMPRISEVKTPYQRYLMWEKAQFKQLYKANRKGLINTAALGGQQDPREFIKRLHEKDQADYDRQIKEAKNIIW